MESSQSSNNGVNTSGQSDVAGLLGDPSTQTVPSSFDIGFDIHDPVELLFMFDDDIANGITVLHPWQTQFMLDFADSRHTKDSPFKAEVRTCNGSGKDKYIVAACAVWMCMRYKEARGVVTNGSGQQLDNQTEAYIEKLCQRVNAKLGAEIWRCNYRYYECIATGSPITLFATDEPTKAEGYHPFNPGRKMVIFASEAKSIPDEIFVALNRCTGFTHRVDVSSPGLPMGTFYDRCSMSINRYELADIKDCPAEDSIEYHIKARMCPHITRAEIETMAREMPGGRTGAAFLSAVEAEFGTTDEMVVIPHTYVWYSYTKAPTEVKWIPEAYNKAGLDLSDGGDETVLVVRNGNKMLACIPFRFDNSQQSVAFLEEKFKEWDLNHPESFIFGDYGGLGGPILQQLKQRGWSNIRFVDNRNKPARPKTYLNRGTELWFHFAELLKKHEIILLRDDKLIKQLSGRYYKIDINNIHRLLSKLEQRSKGYRSPDRADATVLAFWDYKSTIVADSLEEEKRPFKTPTVVAKPISSFDLRSYASDSQETWQSKKRSVRIKNFSIMQEQIDAHNREIKLKQAALSS